MSETIMNTHAEVGVVLLDLDERHLEVVVELEKLVHRLVL